MSKNGKNQAPPPNTDATLLNPITVTEMVAGYRKAIRMIEEGYQSLGDAQDLLTVTFGNNRSFSVMDREHYHDSNAEKVKRQLHKTVWSVIVDKMDVWRMLSLKRAEELRKLLADGQITDSAGQVIQTLPEINEEEIFLMYQAMRENAAEFAEEFALEVYEWLTPGNKKYSRWEAEYVTNKREARDRLGKKVILSWMIDSEWGNLRVRYGKEDKLAALDRLFYLLDQQTPPEVNTYNSPIVVAINQSKPNSGFGETEYFKFRACQNGNLHLEFLRPDLVQQLNYIAGNPGALRQKQYKTQKGDHTQVKVQRAPEAEEERREEAFYFTPEPVVRRMLELVPMPPPLLMAGLKFLEPSAGEAHIADVLVDCGVSQAQLTLVEKNYDRVGKLLYKGYPDVRDMDFLKLTEAGWDYIYGNPPFNQEQSMLHFMHAHKLLKPGGWLCMVMSDHDFTAKSRAAQYFQDWFTGVGGRSEKLPPGSFRPAGASIDTRVAYVQKERAQ